LHVCRWGSESLKRCYSLCQHMMHFFHQYLLYVTFEVLEPLWHTMSSQCRTANTLDEELPCSHLPPPPAPPATVYFTWLCLADLAASRCLVRLHEVSPAATCLSCYPPCT